MVAVEMATGRVGRVVAEMVEEWVAAGRVAVEMVEEMAVGTVVEMVVVEMVVVEMMVVEMVVEVVVAEMVVEMAGGMVAVVEMVGGMVGVRKQGWRRLETEHNTTSACKLNSIHAACTITNRCSQ